MSRRSFPMEHITSRIRFVRGQKVMLDEDLAALYGVPTKALAQAVKRNMKRFPSDFMFQITDQELTILKSQIGDGLSFSVESMTVARNLRARPDEGGSPEQRRSWVRSRAAAAKHLSKKSSHGFDGVGGARKTKFWMREVGAIEAQSLQELANGRLDAHGSAVGKRQATQPFQGTAQVLALGQFQCLANEFVDLFANRAATKGVAHTATMNLELEQQMELTQLQHPTMLAGELAHPGQVVDGHCLNTLLCLPRNGRKDLAPSGGALLAREEHRVEEYSVVASARFQCRQIQYPRHAVELEPQSVGKQHQRPARDSLGTGSIDKTLERLAESIPQSRQGDPLTLAQELTERKAAPKHLVQNRRGRAVHRTPALLRTNRPRSLALHALSSSLPEAANVGSTTRGFRMFGLHTCELAPTPTHRPREKSPLA